MANYPFATIEPNVGVVEVKDPRLDSLAQVTKDENKMDSLPPKIYATVSFVDIAGLVKGASEGAGLGNKFLSHIREVDAIVQVVRFFKDTNVIHTSEAPDPQSDLDVVNTELILADLQTLQNVSRKTKNETLQKVEKGLNEGKLVRDLSLTGEEYEEIKPLQLLTAKPMFYVANVSEDQLASQGPTLQGYEGTIPISAKVESELSSLSEEEQKEYLKELGAEESGLDKIIHKGYEILDLISFLTAGVKEVRAWTIKRGSTALGASGVIHSDFEKKFIKAEVVSFDDFVNFGGWKGSREAGKARIEGRDYVMKDHEIVEFKIGT